MLDKTTQISLFFSNKIMYYNILGWTLQTRMEVVWVEWEVCSGRNPYQMELGVLESWRSEKCSKQAIMLPRKYQNSNGIPSGALCSNWSFWQ